MMRTSQRMLLLGLPLVLAVAACSSGGDSVGDAGATTTLPAVTTAAPGTTADPGTTAAPETTAAPGSETTSVETKPEVSDEPAGGVSSFEQVQPAVVQIVAQGTLRDPEIGQADASGSGSGFLISPDGLAVTNNHVVTGAATLEVFVGGDTSQSYNARIVGASECNDLALIQIDGAGDLPYLEWYDGEITAGLDVYAAGFPLGDPEFTLTSGIVTKAQAAGDITRTSSIDHTVEHDASTHPGNSGGPVVSEEGQVVAVHYASLNLDSGSQKYAIASDLAQPVIDRLQDGDFESLGINGWAVVDDEAGLSGIWVAGVAPGSPAAEAQLLPGDIVTTMNGLPVGTDGTFRDYCDVIRTAGEGGPITVDVIRFDTLEGLRGEINGGQPIVPVLSFAEEVDEEVGEEAAAVPVYEFDSLTDDTGRIFMDVPTAWTSRSTSPVLLDDGVTQAPNVAASTNLEGFINGWTDPGVLFTAFPARTDIDAALAEYGFAGDCTDAGITDYSDAVFTGKYQVWSDCAGTTTDVVTLVALPADESYLALIQAQIVTDADLAALDQAFRTFNANAG